VPVAPLSELDLPHPAAARAMTATVTAAWENRVLRPEI
jgi:hypothetical protein